MSKKIFIPCNEANHVCDKTQYKEANLWEKLKLILHLIYCSACRKYTKNNKKLTTFISKEPISMDASAKENLKSVFEQELIKHQQ